MKIVYSDKHAQHDPQTFFVRGVKQRSAEQPERATRLLAAAKDAGHEIIAPESLRRRAGRERAHAPSTSTSCKPSRATGRSCPNASAEVVPNVHPARYPATYPKALAGRAGWHQVDLACPIGPHTWDAALASSEVADDRGRHGAGRRAACLCALPAARPSRLCRHGGRLLLPEQHRHRRPAAARQARARRRARCRRPSRQRHAGHLLRARRRAHRVDPRRSQPTTIPTSGATRTRPAPARVKASTSTCRCRWARPTRRGSTPATRRWRASANSRRPRWSWRWASTPAKAIRCRA